MMLIDVIPQEFFDGVPVQPAVSLDGELMGALDEASAGAWVAQMLEGVDLTTLTTLELATYMRMCSRLQAWAASCLDTAVMELAARRDPCVAADAEVSFALREPLQMAQRRIHRAQRLRAMLPAFKRAFHRGDLSEYDVMQLVDATSCTDDAGLLARVQESTLANLRGQSGKELRRYARRLLDRLDPSAANRRAQKARTNADVTLQPGEDGMASIVTDQPVEDAMIVKAAVDAKAITMKQAGDTRAIGVLRAESLTQLCADYLTGCNTAGPVPRSGGRPIEINVVVGLHTVLGLADLPGEVPAGGLVPREDIARMIATERARLRLLVVDDGDGPGRGRVVYRGHRSYRPTPEQVAYVRAAFPTSLGPASRVRADRCDVDHFTQWPDGATVETNLGPFDRPWHNRKTRGSLSVTVDDSGAVTVTTILGQSRVIDPYDYSSHLDGLRDGRYGPTNPEPAPF
jgi:hypothetical protein